ncbi:hypothetical protein V5N11_020552 [Cardamine amara subsp. amara]|uniref:Endonuclease/exonuclease/phosphatase domain-containing protein n=1 Tax=Cardamine amara subsp. amara TaxID=228776 RepID=A0ABD1AUZ1_CARAN
MRREHFLDFLFLLETKNSSHYVLKMQRSLGYDMVQLVEPERLSDGLALFWKSSYEVEVLRAEKRIIDVKVKLRAICFFISFGYGEPARHLRQGVWDSLTEIGSTRLEAWLVVGDLNEQMDNSKKLGGPTRDDADFIPFRNMIIDCGLKEIPSSENRISWVGTRNNEYIQCCLDRALGNSDSFNLFPRGHTEYLERIDSDHRPILTRFTNENMSRQRRFMFDKRWTSKPEVEVLIRESWNSGNREDSLTLFESIVDVRRTLSKWKRKTNTNSKKNITNLRDKLEAERNKLVPKIFHRLNKIMRKHLILCDPIICIIFQERCFSAMYQPFPNLDLES